MEVVNMRKEEFKEWLSTRIKKKPTSDCMSRCKAVEIALHTDLDAEYALDKGKRLLQKMQYSISDERKQKAAPTEFHFKDNANIRYRMANLRSAVNKYFEFFHETTEVFLQKVLQMEFWLYHYCLLLLV